MDDPTVLRKYTSLAVAIHALRHNQITFVDPQRWDDRNDVAYLEEYKQRRKLKSLLATCFTTKPERYHHWKSFADGTDGTCLIFRTDKLLESIPKKAFKHQLVCYKLNQSDDPWRPTTEELPFVKRVAYEDEGEYRILYESRQETLQTIDFPVTDQCLARIVISPRLPRQLYESVQEQLQLLVGRRQIGIERSTILESRRWLNRLKDKNKFGQSA